jgi:hypothetical protein
MSTSKIIEEGLQAEKTLQEELEERYALAYNIGVCWEGEGEEEQ